MGFRYQELKDRGDSIELERKESYTTERSHNGYIKRHKTVVRERFPHPNVKEGRKTPKPQRKRSAFTTTHKPETASERTTTETFGNTPESGVLLTTCRDKSHLERAVNRTSVQLKRLAHEIDNEIAKLKRERDKLMFRTRPHRLMRNAAIQNDLQAKDEPLDKLKDYDTQLGKNNSEFTIEKFSRQHQFVCASPRYARDEQTSCRPRMRTIGLQKDTQRGAVGDNLQNLKAKINAAINHSATNLEALKSKGLLDTAPPNCYAFDYGGTGDGKNALNVYHLQNCRCAGGCNQNDCNCAKNCERYNTVGNYNGMLCNKDTYVEKGMTPCTEYKYCRDEYHYNYPSQNKCLVPTPNRSCLPCTPCVPAYQPCQPCQPCLPPCPTYSECQPVKAKEKVLYGRRMSDLNTAEFYHPTSSRSRKHSPYKHDSPRHSKNKERLTVDVPKDGRTLVDIERSGERARSKTRRKHESEEKTKQRSSKTYDAVAARKANEKRQLRERKPRQESESSGSVDSSEKARQMKSKEKLLEITFTKERRHRPSSESGEECIMYEMPKQSREYSRETKRSLKQMTITAYKPCKPVDSEGKSDLDRKQKQKGKGRVADDDKTWDERLRQREYPPAEDDWHAGIPTITEVYDEYRADDTYGGDGHNIIQEPTEPQYVGGYREMYQVSPQRSYDIMPVQKNTVRDIPPTQGGERGRRIQRDEPMRPSERVGGSYERDRTASGTGPGGQPRIGRGGRQRESYEKERSEVLRAYGIKEKPGRSYGRTYDDSRSPGPYDQTTRQGERYDPNISQHERYEPKSTPRSARDHERGIKSEERYDSRGSPRKVYNEPNAAKGRTYTPDETPRSARDYERGIKSEERYDSRGPPRNVYNEHSVAPERTYTPDETPRSARYEPHSPTSRIQDPHAYDPDVKPHLTRGVEPGDKTKMEQFSPSHSRDKYASSEKLERKRSSRDDISSIDQRAVKDPQQTSERKFKKEDALMYEDMGQSSKKPDISAADLKIKGEMPDDWSQKAKVKEESTVSPQTSTQRTGKGPTSDRGPTDSPQASTPRTGKGYTSDRGLADSEQISENVLVPGIKIEDTDENGRSAPRSGRERSSVSSLRDQAKLALKGEVAQEPKQMRSPKYIDRDKQRQLESRSQPDQIRSSPGRKPDIYEGTVTGAGFARASTSGVMGGATSPLSPFPSLETPKIYMKPRALCTDYGTACFPPVKDDCAKRSSPRGNCVANAGDVYMCPPPPCQCLCPAESGSEIPYEKLGDQYTHSPVRQLAANSHLAVALQSDIAANSYKPLPQESVSKSCITLRSTGTQYSATIIERPEDRCAPLYVPLPKVCSEILADEAEDAAAQSTCNCDSSPRNSKSPCSSPDSAKQKYQFLCEESREECDETVNLKNNEQWCGRVEINTEKREIFIARQPKSHELDADEKNYLLPWQQDEKFIPGQPISSCNMPPWQDGSMKFLQTVQKIPRCPNYAERRTPRFNATMPPHQEMPEEEDRCAQELPQYKPQPRVQFMEQNGNCDPGCYALNEANLQNEAADCMPRGRLSFAYGGEYQQIPEFTGCPCMFKTYLNMVTLYYPDCRVQLREDCVEIDEDDAFNE